jgi:CDI immunity proteins
VPHRIRPMAEKSVDELEGYGIPPPFATPLIESVAAARRVPLRALSVEQLRLLIGQSQALTYLLPVALDRLERDPLVAGDFYRGDLLIAVLRAVERWRGTTGFEERVRTIVDRALARLEEVPAVNWTAGEVADPDEPDEIDRRKLEPELRAARERFG